MGMPPARSTAEPQAEHFHSKGQTGSFAKRGSNELQARQRRIGKLFIADTPMNRERRTN